MTAEDTVNESPGTLVFAPSDEGTAVRIERHSNGNLTQ
jgi:hypothetical protein